MKFEEKESLYDKLIEHNKNQVYPMHMPGHKRNTQMMSMVNPYSIDITEIDGFDNMHSPTGIIKDIIDEANDLYKAKRTWLCVNGSSIGIMAAICATTKKGDSILIARNSHKSVYNAIELNELRPHYIYPEYIGCGINGQDFLTDIVKKIEENPEICVVVVTNPTYEGVVSDIESIAKYLHSKGKILIVDAAHGAHLGFNNEFPESAIECGADIVIHSIHKTLPAFTQTSLLHVVSAERVNISRVNKYISLFQSSSPSYIMMAGIEKCINVVRKSQELFKNYNNYLEKFYEGAKKLRYISVLDYKKDGVIWRDKSKIVIIGYEDENYNNNGNNYDESYCNKYGGSYIYHKLLDEYNIQLEMKSNRYTLAMTSICDTEEGIEKLLMALVNIDREIDVNLQNLHKNTCEIVGNSVDNVDNLSVEKAHISTLWDYGPSVIVDKCAYAPSQIQELLITPVKIWKAVDKISGEYVYLYPPDIPLLVPGEVITKEFIAAFEEYKKAGFNIEGLEDENLEYIRVVAE